MRVVRSTAKSERRSGHNLRPTQPRAMLGPLVAAFTEGHDLHDLRLARTILDG
jgi:hypothetical protein